MPIREIEAGRIADVVAGLCVQSNLQLGRGVLEGLQKAIASEESPVGRGVLQQLVENAAIAAKQQLPLCQDCGVAVFFVEIGQDIHITGGSLQNAITEGTGRGYSEGYLRKSMVVKPFSARTNTGNNAPPVIHYQIVPGDRLKIAFMAKGGGAENMSRTAMLKPGDGANGIADLVVETVKTAGGAACPPLIIGVGIGGTLEKAALLAKRALLRPVGEASSDEETALLEKEVLDSVNRTGIGPMGTGGRMTALAVHIETYPCHIANLPVVVNLQCHSTRHAEVVV
jgi:fumarate hydratase subunit alpha